MDGYLKIKTKIDNKDVDKGITELENKIKKLQDSNANSSQDQHSLQEEINNYERLHQKAGQYRQKLKELNTEKDLIFKSNPGLAVSTDTPQYANVKAQITEMQQKYAQATSEIDKQAPKIDKVYAKLEKIKSKQSENNTKIAQFRQEMDKIQTNKLQASLNNVGKNIQNQIGKIGKMAMAVIGIRTAWNAVRGAMSSVAQYNPQIAADFEYMRFCISNLLAPAVQWLTKLLYTVLSYVNAIANAWFGINLFGNSSAKAFQKMQKSARGTAKSTKEIQKSLQGFDEMNVLQDTTDKGSSGGVASPSMDLSGIQGDVPVWLKWIMDNKDIILSLLAGITAGLISMKLLGLDPLTSLGIGIVIAGIVLLVQDIIKFIQNPSWENFVNILRDIAVVVTGIGVLVGLATGNWIPLLIGLIALIVVEVIKHWDEICEILGKVGQWIYDNVIKPVIDFFQRTLE